MDKSRIGAEWDEPGLEPSRPIPIWDGGVSRLVSAAPGKKKDMIKNFTFPITCFHFQYAFWNELPFSKYGSFSKGVFIFKMSKVSWGF